MTLFKSTSVWGDELLLPSSLAAPVIEGAVFAPKITAGAYDFDAGWGIYDAANDRVEAATYRRGPGINYVGQGPRLTFPAAEIAAAPCAHAIYGGVAHTHFGHFLVSTLARLWVAGTDRAPPGTKYLFHMDRGPAEWFALPFVADCLRALGIFEEDILPLARPTRFDALTVPEPSFEETRAFSPAFRETALAIGRTLRAERVVEPGRPVYLSKERLAGGVKKFANESELVERLRAGGVIIVHPETLSLAQQVSLFQDASVVVGSLSSAFHTSIMSPSRTRLIGLNHDANILSTFTMIDRLTGNPALYVHQNAGFADGGDPHFMATFQLPDPRGAAEDLLRIIDNDLSCLVGF
ncbi:hypothetical protein BH10PSE4_BH10PSE4_08730 [soil metagenome]